MNNLKKKATLSILLMVSMGHLLNDMFQSVIPLSSIPCCWSVRSTSCRAVAVLP